jgi:hypothetical protein
MYLGVHTLLDVGVSIAIALVLIFVAYPLFKKAERSPKLMFAILGTITLLTLAYLLFATLFPFPADTDPHNLESAQKNGYTLFGCMLGLILAYAIDLKYTKFDTKAVWWAQLIKIVGGLLLVLAVKEGLRAPLEFIFDGHLIARGIRYFLMVVVGGILWPMSFKYFSKINNKEKEEK